MCFERFIIKINAQVNKFSELPDAFITIVQNDDEHFLFKRFNLNKFIGINQEFSFYHFNLDKSVVEIDSKGVPGIIQLRMSVNDSARIDKAIGSGILNDFHFNAKPQYQNISVLIQLFQAKKLPSADKNGLSDPFV